jgi:hypothetical protein
MSKFGGKAIAQAIGTEQFTLLELAPKNGVDLEIQDTVYIGKGKRDKIYRVLGKLDYENLTATSRIELEYAIRDIVEANEEKNISEDYLIVKGAVFDFKNSLLPVEFAVKSKGGINYFESLDASPKKMTFTKVWGTINCTTVVTKKEEESAFGEPVVKEFTNTRREWIVTGTSKPDAVYEIGDEKNGITDEEIKKAVADREIYLADVKKRQDEYQASKNSSVASEVPFGTGTATAPAAEGGFNF